MPIDANFCDRQIESATEFDQFDVEGPAAQMQRGEEELGSRAGEQFESALGIPDARPDEHAHTQMEAPHKEIAQRTALSDRLR